MDKPRPIAHFTVDAPAPLLAFLLQKMPQQSRNSVKALLQNGQIWINGQPVRQFDYPLKALQQVEIQRDKMRINPPPSGLPILFEDPHLIAVEKPAGLLSMAANQPTEPTAYNKLSAYVKQQNPKNKIFIVHRLDRDTSGVMVFAKTEQVQQLLQNTWHDGHKMRVYLAVTEGAPQPPVGKITSYLRESKALVMHSSQDPKQGQYAATHYETVEATAAHALLKITLETGRKNQIRVHLQDLGTPLVGDKKYGATTNPLQRLGLHAWSLAFKHPVSGESLCFETKIPAVFLRLF